MFKSFKYSQDHDLYGILINKNEIKLGDSDLVNKKYNYIKIGIQQEYNDYYFISFDNTFDADTIDNLTNLFNIELQKNTHETIESIIDTLASYFSIYKNENLYKKYLGLCSELFFIYKLKTEGINITDNYQFGHDLYDFHFKNGNIEIKTINKSASSIKMNVDQLEYINELGNELVCVYPVIDSANGLSVKDLFNLIDFNNSVIKENIINFIQEVKINHNSLLSEIKFDKDKTSLILFNKGLLPDSDFIKLLKQNNSFISAIFEFKICPLEKNILNLVKELNND